MNFLEHSTFEGNYSHCIYAAYMRSSIDVILYRDTF